MKKLLSVIGLIILAIVLIVVGWFVYKSFAPKQTPESPTEQPAAAETPKEEAAQKAVETVPELNPIEKANPFSGSYKNPFKK